MPDVGLYVTNEASGDLTVIDAATLKIVTTIPLGKRPRGLAASADGTRLYVALSGSPAAPPGVDEKTLPPPDRSADGIGVVDLQEGKLLKVLPSGTDPEQVALSPDGQQVYVANEDAARASVVDVETGKVVETFKTGGEPEGVSVEPVNGRVWVTSEEDGAVYVIDLKTKRTPRSVKVGPRPRSVAFLPDGSKAYTALGERRHPDRHRRAENAGAENDHARHRHAPDGHCRRCRRQARVCLHRAQQVGAGGEHVDRYGGRLSRSRRQAVGHRDFEGRLDALHGKRAGERRVGHRRDLDAGPPAHHRRPGPLGHRHHHARDRGGVQIAAACP